MAIVHDGGNSAVHLIGGDHGYVEILHRGVTFLDSSVIDQVGGGHLGGFCSSCFDNEYWDNTGHGLVYQITNIADPRHVGEYIDSNGDVGWL